jgi:spore germination protein
MSLCRSNLLCVFLLLACLSGVVIAQEPKPDTSVTIHVVQRGETLFRIATRYNTTVDDLVRLNGITNPGSIQVGQRLLVPTHAAPDGMADGQIHIVQPGETLATIAALYNLDIEELNHRNMIPDSGAVYIGQTLHIPISDRPSAESSVQTADPAPQPAPQEISVSQATTILHTVQRGETLFRIAAYYGITVNELARANNIADPSLIYNGQQLVIPGYEAPQPVSYTHLTLPTKA